ncbi:hypothetical protein JCM8547_003407 [Rhodosporidiobolus lusitaniae]
MSPSSNHASPVASTSRVTIEMTPLFAKHLCDCFFQSAYISHPTLSNFTLRDSLEALNWNVELLPTSARAQARAIFAVAGLFSFSPLIVGSDGPTAGSFAEVSALAPDLRSFGRRRREAVRALKLEAVRAAKDADVMLEPTVENCATCMLLNVLSDLDEPLPVSRPWHAAYLSHLRALSDMIDNQTEPMAISAVRWGAFFASESLSDLPVGRLALTRSDELLFVGGDPPEPASFLRGLEATLERPIDRSLWPDLKPLCLLYLATTRELVTDLLGPHARRLPLNEHALLKSLNRLHELRRICLKHGQIMTRLLEPYEPLDRNLFPVPCGRVRHTRSGALGAMRAFSIWSWTSFAVPFYREVQRRAREAKLGATLADANGDPAAQLQAERLDVYLRQARDLALLALESFASIVEGAPVAFLTQTRQVVPAWAQFVVEELENMTVLLDDKLCALIDTLIVGLKHHGYVYSSSATDFSIAKLEGFVLGYRVSTQPQSREHVVQLCSSALQYEAQLAAVPTHEHAPPLTLPNPPTVSPLPSTSSAADLSLLLDATTGTPDLSSSTSMLEANGMYGSGGKSFVELAREGVGLLEQANTLPFEEAGWMIW